MILGPGEKIYIDFSGPLALRIWKKSCALGFPKEIDVLSHVLHFALCFPKEINGFRTFPPDSECKWPTKTYLSFPPGPKINFGFFYRFNLLPVSMGKFNL